MHSGRFFGHLYRGSCEVALDLECSLVGQLLLSSTSGFCQWRIGPPSAEHMLGLHSASAASQGTRTTP